MENKKEVEVELEEIATVEEDKEKEDQDKEKEDQKETKGKRFNKIFHLQAVTKLLTKFKIGLLSSLWERLHHVSRTFQSSVIIYTSIRLVFGFFSYLIFLLFNGTFSN